MERPKDTEIKGKQKFMQNPKADISVKNEQKEQKQEAKQETKQEKKIEIKKGSIKKTEAVVNGMDIGISLKQAVALCNYIRGKNIDKAIMLVEEVRDFKKPLPMRGELPHRHGIMSGRNPVKASGEFIRLLKSLKANAIANELELEKVRIFCKANLAPRPYKRFGKGRFKRSHVTLKLIEPKIKK
ncbi:MAG: uL22 family ribosomal protein [Candidatus Nanoarchaeia archaeon]